MTTPPIKLGGLSDEELMGRYADGDILAFNALYERYKGIVYGFLKKKLPASNLVDEIFQDIWMRLHQSRLRYDRSLSFTPWLFTIVRNRVIDEVRKAKELVPLDEEEIGVEHSSALVTGQTINLSSMKAELSEREWQTIQLRFLEDRSFNEISAITGMSTANSRKIISRTLKKLRGIFLATQRGEK